MYNNYCQAIETNLETLNFKQNPAYQCILEHVSFDLGKAYIQVIAQKYGLNEKYNDLFKENDQYGNPIKYYFQEFNITTSPSNFRYLLHSLDIRPQLRPKVDILEIGGGYGGLCLYLFRLAGWNINSYTIIDLPEPCKLQQKYLDLHKIPAKCVSDVNILKKDYFLISNYALSEFDDQTYNHYINTVVPWCSHGYLIWNTDRSIPSFSNTQTIEPEIPQTGTINKIVKW